MHQTDEYLLEMAIQGDGGSFGALVQRWEGKIYGFIRRYVGDREDARDLTQNTFVKAYQHLDRLSNPAYFSAWLYKIALNECRMCFRRRKGSRAVPLEETQREVDEQERVDVLPDRTFEGRERVQQLTEAFQLLPPEQREVILMKEFQGLRFQDIAAVLDIPLSTAKSRLYLGLKTLRRLMEERHDL